MTQDAFSQVNILLAAAELASAKSREAPLSSARVSSSPEPPPALAEGSAAAAAAAGWLASPRALRVESELRLEPPSPSAVQVGRRPEGGKRGPWSVLSPERAARKREREPQAVPEVLSEASSMSSSTRSASSPRTSNSSDSGSRSPSPARARSVSKRGTSYIGISEPQTLMFSEVQVEPIVAPVSMLEEGEELHVPPPGALRARVVEFLLCSID